MPKPRLSELPDFLPIGKPGSPEELACAVGTFSNHEANLDFFRMIARSMGAKCLVRQHAQSPTEAAPGREKAAGNAR